MGPAPSTSNPSRPTLGWRSRSGMPSSMARAGGARARNSAAASAAASFTGTSLRCGPHDARRAAYTRHIRAELAAESLAVHPVAALLEGGQIKTSGLRAKLLHYLWWRRTTGDPIRRWATPCAAVSRHRPRSSRGKGWRRGTRFRYSRCFRLGRPSLRRCGHPRQAQRPRQQTRKRGLGPPGPSPRTRSRLQRGAVLASANRVDAVVSCEAHQAPARDEEQQRRAPGSTAARRCSATASSTRTSCSTTAVSDARSPRRGHVTRTQETTMGSRDGPGPIRGPPGMSSDYRGLPLFQPARPKSGDPRPRPRIASSTPESSKSSSHRALRAMARPGLEPGTPRFSVVCSTN